MPVSPKKRMAVAKRRERVAEHYLAGMTQEAIAAELNVSQSTISSDLKALKQEWQESANHDFVLLKEMERKRLDRLDREAWDGWRRSQKPMEVTRIVQTDNGRHIEKRIVPQVGDRRYLELLLRIAATRHKLMGLDAAAESASTEGQKVYVDGDDMSRRAEKDDDPIERILANARKGPEELETETPARITQVNAEKGQQE